MTRRLRYAGGSNLNLANNQAHAFAANYALCGYESDFVYSFIPKNACTTLRYSLAIANGAIAGPDQFNWIHNNNTTFKASLRELAQAKYTFVVLRDPFLRLVSCFLDKLVEQTPVAYSLHRLTNYATSPHDLTFRAFVGHLKAHLRGDEHWRPQADYLVYETYDDVFALEDFAHAAETLQARIGFAIHDARTLAGHGTDRYEIIDDGEGAADLTAFDLLAAKRAGRIPSPRAFYDSALVEKVADLFALDLKLYCALTGRDASF